MVIRRLLAAVSVWCAAVLCACSAPDDVAPESLQPLPEPTVTTTEAPAPVSAPAQPSQVQLLLDDTVAETSALYGGDLGIAVWDGAEAVSSGFVAPSAAWSTIKVPIAIAALRANPGLYPDAQLALTVSDNDAAARLYDAVGPAAVEAVLAEMGVAQPVNTVLTRPGFSTFGQTMLTVGQEAHMARAMLCLPGASDVRALMGQVDPSQAYGLGATGPALYKGGWGPDEAGAYEVRQFGLLPKDDGSYVAVALTALPGDGTYGTGQGMLNAAALALQERAGELPDAVCG